MPSSDIRHRDHRAHTDDAQVPLFMGQSAIEGQQSAMTPFELGPQGSCVTSKKHAIGDARASNTSNTASNAISRDTIEIAAASSVLPYHQGHYSAGERTGFGYGGCIAARCGHKTDGGYSPEMGARGGMSPNGLATFV